MPDLKATTELTSSSVENVLAGLQRAHELNPDDELTIDLSQLARLERPAGSLLASALVGSLDSAQAVVKLPRGGRDWVTASGLAFAIANRSGATRLDGELDLTGWSQPWRTGDADSWHELTTQRDGLFDADAIGGSLVRPDRFGPHFAAFVDAHLAPTAYAPDHPLTNVVWPWLDRLLPVAGITDRDVRGRFIASVGTLVAETVGNVRQHAGGGSRPLHSLVQLAVTRGGTGSHDRLHLIVLDNGRGIVATARPKIDPHVETELSDHELLFKLCDGSLPPWGRGRGKGLPLVVSTARKLGGGARIWTRTSHLEARPGTGSLVTGDDTMRVDGTLVSVVLPLVA